MQTPYKPILRTVWLDSLSELSQIQQFSLERVGIELLHTAQTLAELGTYMQRAQLLVVRLLEDVSPLAEALALCKQLNWPVHIVCRMPRHRIELAAHAMRLGARHVLPADEWSESSWREVMDWCGAGVACGRAQSQDATRNGATRPKCGASGHGFESPRAIGHGSVDDRCRRSALA